MWMRTRMTANDPLFSPLQLGALRLSHRVVMPPAHRGRASPPESAPDLLMARYYGQRATSGGLLISETAYICPAGHRERTRPGLYSIAQVNRWRDVTDAVHQHGGIMLAHLGYAWDTAGALADMDSVLEDYRSAAENASDAGFDGIELDACADSLPAHLLQHGFVSAQAPLLDIVQTLCAVWEPARIGIGMPARSALPHQARLGTLGLAYLRLTDCGGRARPAQAARLEGPGMPPLVLSGRWDAATAAHAIASGEAAAIGFEADFIANPDLAARLRAGAPLASADPATLECGGERGYTDYPRWAGAERLAP